RNARNAAEMTETSKRDGVDLRAIELDVQSEPSVNAAVEKVIGESGRIDVVVYNAGHMIGLRRSPYLGENSDAAVERGIGQMAGFRTHTQVVGDGRLVSSVRGISGPALPGPLCFRPDQ